MYIVHICGVYRIFLAKRFWIKILINFLVVHIKLKQTCNFLSKSTVHDYYTRKYTLIRLKFVSKIHDCTMVSIISYITPFIHKISGRKCHYHISNIWRHIVYRVSQKSGTLDFRYFDIRKIQHIFISSDKILSSEKNDTKIIWFGSVVLILQPFLKTQSFTNFVKSARAIYGG